jgi:hypothetical protein
MTLDIISKNEAKDMERHLCFMSPSSFQSNELISEPRQIPISQLQTWTNSPPATKWSKLKIPSFDINI